MKSFTTNCIELLMAYNALFMTAEHIYRTNVFLNTAVTVSSGHFSVFVYLHYPLPSARQHWSYGDCLEVKSEYYQNCSMLDCVTQCSQSAAHLYEQFLQVQQIRFVTLGPLRHAQRQWSKVVLL